jgi:hypothetical protein
MDASSTHLEPLLYTLGETIHSTSTSLLFLTSETNPSSGHETRDALKRKVVEGRTQADIA